MRAMRCSRTASLARHAHRPRRLALNPAAHAPAEGDRNIRIQMEPAVAACPLLENKQAWPANAFCKPGWSEIARAEMPGGQSSPRSLGLIPPE